jgi:hypothetical protein
MSVDVWLRDHRAYITSPYDAEFLLWFKGVVPSAGRRWDRATRQWIVEERYWKAALYVLSEWFGIDAIEVEGSFEEHPTVKVPKSIADAFTTLELLPSAPPQLIQAAYRALSHIHHPDHGGDAERMRQINAAFDMLRDRT